MEIDKFFEEEQIQLIIGLGIPGVIVLLITFLIIRSVRKSNRLSREVEKESKSLKNDNGLLQEELRTRIIDHVKLISRVIQLNPVVPGNTPEDNTLEGRCRAKCLDLLIEGLPKDTKSQGIRMAEFLHHLCDYLLKAYGKEEAVNIKIDAQPIILDVESAVSVGLMLNELVSNAIQYGQDPGVKCRITIFFKEREGKLVINVADNGIGMKVPYVPKYSFGLQLTSTLVKLHKGDLIISSRPGTRVEILLSEYKTAVREVYITPTRRIY